VRVLNCWAVEWTGNNLVTNTRKVTDTAATNQNNGVLLEVVALTRNVSGYLNAINKTNTSNLTEC